VEDCASSLNLLTGDDNDANFLKNFFEESQTKSDFLTYLDRRFSKIGKEMKDMKFGIQQFMDDTDPCLHGAIKDIGDLQGRINACQMNVDHMNVTVAGLQDAAANRPE
jgi:hypothetical protein